MNVSVSGCLFLYVTLPTVQVVSYPCPVTARIGSSQNFCTGITLSANATLIYLFLHLTKLVQLYSYICILRSLLLTVSLQFAQNQAKELAKHFLTLSPQCLQQIVKPSSLISSWSFKEIKGCFKPLHICFCFQHFNRFSWPLTPVLVT